MFWETVAILAFILIIKFLWESFKRKDKNKDNNPDSWTL